MKVWMDTKRPDRLNREFVECTAHVRLAGQDVQVAVTAFGEGREGTDKAFDRMESVLEAMGFGDEQRVRTLATVPVEKVRVH